MTSGDALVGVFAALAAGTVLAIVVAVALSPLAPIGPARSVYPDKGVAFDWTVLGLGALVLVVALGLSALAVTTARLPTASRSGRRTRCGCGV